MEGPAASVVATFDVAWSHRPAAASYSRRHVTGPDDDRDETLGLLRQRLLAFARRRLEPAAAEDIAQEALLLLTTKYAHVRDADELRRVGIEIARKKMAGHWRRAQRRGETRAVDPLAVHLPDGTPGPEDVAVRRQRLDRLRSAVARLGGRCREIVRLKLEDRTFPEIAEVLKAKLNTVYSWDHRCTERLRELLAAEERARR